MWGRKLNYARDDTDMGGSRRRDLQRAGYQLEGKEKPSCHDFKAEAAIEPTLFDITRTNLPIFQQREQILALLNQTQTFIIHGETGCGKSTQVPQYILEEFPHSKIAVTQPRRMSTISLAKRVSEERRTPLGSEVGYQISFDRRVANDTKICFMTTGFLIAKLTADFDRVPWTHVILDEIHERSIEMDFLLVMMKHLLMRQKDLKLILMSATVDSDVFANYFASSSVEDVYNSRPPLALYENTWHLTRLRWGGTDFQKTCNRFREPVEDAARQIVAGGRPFEVTTKYIEDIYADLDQYEPFRGFVTIDKLAELYRGSRDDRLDEVDERLYQLAALIVLRQHTTQQWEPEGLNSAFLIFLPGLHEINLMQDALQTTAQELAEVFEVCVLHSAMPEELHSKVFDECPANKRRVILSTNIAESSITLPDVRFVIDFGFSKEVAYNSLTRMQTLELKWSSKATMNQRRGRAGRVAKGMCYRLMPQQFFDCHLADFAKPEIQRCPLDKLILRLKLLPNLGTPAEVLYRTIEPPDITEISRTELYLKEMGALDDGLNLTWLGKRYSEMPCDIRVTRLIIFGYIFGIAKEALLLAAIMSQDRPPVCSPLVLTAKRRGLSSKHYSARLVYDGGNNSDLIMCLNSFLEWRSKVGSLVCKRISLSFAGGRMERPWPSSSERSYCSENYVDPFVMRAIYQTYLEYQKRLGLIDPSNDRLAGALRSSVRGNFILPHGLDSGSEALKIVIAAAFVGKYLVGSYAISEPAKRKRLIEKLQPDSEAQFIVSSVPAGVRPDHITKILEEARDPNLSVSIDGTTATVKLSAASQTCMRMCLWLGLYNNRYRNGDYVALQRVLRDTDTNLILDKSDITDGRFLYKLPRETKFQGKVIVLEQTEMNESSVACIEAACLGKPDYPYLLRFRDFLTSCEVRASQDSVNYVSVETQESLVDQRAWVCAEYVDKFDCPMARTITALKTAPLTPHLLTMLFSRHIELYPDSHSEFYDSFRTESSEYKFFEYRLANSDLLLINKLRSFVSHALSSDEAFIDAPQTGVKLLPLINDTLFKDRSQIVREANHLRDIADGIYNPSTPEKPGGEAHYNGDYLKPIEISDILDFDVEDYEAKRLEYKRKAEVNFDQLIQRYKFIELKKTELQCKICNYPLGQIDKLKPYDSERGLFFLNTTFGMIRFTSQLPETSPFIDHVTETSQGEAVTWCTCNNGHVINWAESGRCLISPKSPIVVAFPTLVVKNWTQDLWEDNLRNLLTESKAYETARAEAHIELECVVCSLHLKNERDFIKHFNSVHKH